jgi:hypothetical protein
MAAKSNKELYFCSQCKTKVDSIDEVLVVEEFYARPFCSEECIVEYHSPLIREFEKQDLKLRVDLGIEEGFDYKLLKDDPNIINSLVSDPDEVLVNSNQLDEEFYTLVKRIEHSGSSFYCIGICFFYEDNVSLMLFHTVTGSNKLLEVYCDGEEADSEDDVLNDYDIDPQLLEDLEQKKSNYLSQLLSHRSEDDIAFEEYPNYDKYVRQTLNDPDEVYEKEDDDNDYVLTYIKSYQDQKSSFFHIVLAIKLDEDIDSDEDILFPILAFPSRDGQLYKMYRQGERISGGLKN